MKACAGVEVRFHHFLPRYMEVSSLPIPATLPTRVPEPVWMQSSREKSLASCRKSNLGRPVSTQLSVAMPTELSHVQEEIISRAIQHIKEQTSL
jgi:hypothetical protein